MTNAASGDPLSPRIDAVEKELKEVHDGLAAGHRTRRCVFLLVLLFVFGVFGMFYRLYQRVASQEFTESLTAAAQEHLKQNERVYRDHAQKLVEYARPILQQAFSDQVDKDMPKYTAAIDEQRQVLIKNLQPGLRERLDARYAEVLSSYEQRLADEFPQAQDPEVQQRIHVSLERAMDGLVEDYYITQFQTRLDDIHKSWSEFPVADPPQEGDEPLSTQLIGILLEILTHQLTGAAPDEGVLPVAT